MTAMVNICKTNKQKNIHTDASQFLGFFMIPQNSCGMYIDSYIYRFIFKILEEGYERLKIFFLSLSIYFAKAFLSIHEYYQRH